MDANTFSIAELAHAAGLSRRAVRFYVQQQLLPAPAGLGRGRHYDASHLERLQQIARLKESGHSLDAIRRILNGEPEPVNGRHVERRVARPPKAMTATLWTRLELGDGVELQFDAGKYQPEVEGLVALRELARKVFEASDDADR